MLSRAVFFLVLASLMAMTHQQISGSGSMDNRRIPISLIECYGNETLYDRTRRIPSTISTLIAIIQKLENGAAASMDMRTLATTILRQYRVDGIRRDPEITASGVIPFGPVGQEANRQKYLYDKLLPSTGNVFPNGTLTPEEKCSLHFMLSDSIDIWDRGDTCGSLSTFNSRRPRSVDRAAANSTSQESGESVEKKEVKEGIAELMPVMDKEKKNEAAGDDSSKEADLNAKPGKTNTEEITKKVVNVEVQKIPVALPSPEKAPKSGKMSLHPRLQSDQIRSNYPVSNCPLENGVIYTPAGAVSAGIMLTGIATGMQLQTVSVKRLLQVSGTSGSRSVASSGAAGRGVLLNDDQVSSLWFGTLAADLAEAAIYQGPVSGDVKIGASGGWNDTAMPRWYFLNTNVLLEMTDAEIRGGIDGMIFGKKINDWYATFNQRLRLSQVLDMYYSQRGISGNPSYRACQRKDHTSEVAPIEEMKSQAMNAAKLLLSVEHYIVMTDATLQSYTDRASQMLTSYIPSGLVDVPCASTTPGSQTVAVPSVELVIVLDASWTFADIKTLISYLAERIKVGEYGDGTGASGGGGSKLTILSGKDATALPIINGSITLLDFYSNFTFENYSQITPGLDMVKMLQRLRIMYSKSMQRDQQNRMTTGRPQVVLFLPSLSFAMSDSDRNQALTLVNRINIKTPDTRLLFMTPTSKEAFTDFVIDKDRDIFQINSSPDYKTALEPLITRLSEFPRRIINPACNNKWESSGGSGSSVQYADPVSPPLLFRLHPNYFFKSDSTTIRFQGKGDGTLNVCYSRKPIPSGAGINNSSSSSSSSSIKCKSINSDTAEFTETQPCSGVNLIKSCNPMFFSVAATSTNNRCDDSTCHYPDMVRFTVTHSGLTCASGAKGLLTSGLSIVLLTVLLSARETVNRIFFSG